MTVVPATMALIAGAIPLGQQLTAKQIASLLPIDYSLETIRKTMNALVRSGRAEVEEETIGQVWRKRYRLLATGEAAPIGAGAGP